MAFFFKKIKKNVDYILKIAIFLTATFIILILFPHEGKFRYEFQKGKPWMYETLYAPFEFPIYKSKEEIAAERDSVLRDFKPYFRLNRIVIDQNIASFNSSFTFQWNKYFQNDSLSNLKKILHNYSKEHLLVIQDTLRKFLNQLMVEILEKGIIDINDTDFQVLKGYSSFYKVDDNIAQEIKSTEVLTPKKAYESTISAINKASRTRYFSNINFFNPFIQKLNLESFLVQTIVYDESKSEKSKQALLSSLSDSYGAVLADKRIISKEDLVDDSNFRILESLKIEYENRLGNTNTLIIWVGQFIIVVVTLLVLYLFLYNFRRDIYRSNKRSSFLLIIIILITVMASMAIKYHAFNIFIIPFALC